MAKRKRNPTKDASAGATPQFGETQPTGDPRSFKIKHPSDQALYDLMNKTLLQPIPKPRDRKNMVLTLEEVLGEAGKDRIAAILSAGKTVFHSGGDTGSVHGPKTQSLVADKMAADFHGEGDSDIPSFFFHLGDVVYSFGEGKYYYDQFYEPYRNYPAPILAIPGNHDGVVYAGDKAKTLEAFCRNFVSGVPGHSPDALSLVRTSIAQPGVYFAFDAPFVTIIGLYSNVLEDPGVISSEGRKRARVNDQQLQFLIGQLKRVKNSGRAVIVAVHHPPFTSSSVSHGGSPRMLQDLDAACTKAGCWPHAFLSGHSHNYQRFTRTVGTFDVPYVVCGNSGHNVVSLTKKSEPALRAPIKYGSDLILENYDDTNFGYLRIICDATTMRIEYHDANPDQKSESDAVTVDLKSHTMIAN